jgi:hypothetical protein
MYVLVYVDDLIIVSSSKTATTHLLQQLDAEFSIKDHDPLHYFLGIEVSTSSSGLILSQKKYINDLLQKKEDSHARLSSSLHSDVQFRQDITA